MAGVYKKLTRRPLFWALTGTGGLLAVVAITVAALSIPIRSGTLKEKVLAVRSEGLESEVTIESIEGRVFPQVGVSGQGVAIRLKGRTDVPPLISIKRFEIRGSLF